MFQAKRQKGFWVKTSCEPHHKVLLYTGQTNN